MTDQSASPAVPEPAEEEIFALMHAQDRQLMKSPDVSADQKKAIFDFHLARWKEAHSRPEGESPEPIEADDSDNESLLRIDPRRIDSKYKSFPSFGEWLSHPVDVGKWDSHVASLRTLAQTDATTLRKAREIVTRAAAINTGALEQLYEVDRGFTFTVATQAAMWEATLDKKGPEVRALIESQMDAYEMVLDFATKQQPIAAAWLRDLHAELCKSQPTYRALTEVGWQDLDLPLGQYKTSPNHVQGRDGKIHAYSPVDQTPSEIQKLVDELRSDEFNAAHPVLQASYAHYAFVLIHPFADGNGRVARALASVYTYRAESIPLLILSETRNSYIDSLSDADKGNRQPFINFIFDRALDAIRLTTMSLKAASAPAVTSALESYKRLFVTKGGYTHQQVDSAGYTLVDLIVAEFAKQARAIEASSGIQTRILVENRNDYPIPNPEVARLPVTDNGRQLVVEMKSKTPTEGIAFRFGLSVPKDCDVEDEILLNSGDIPIPFPARITEMLPEVSSALQLRSSIFVEAILGLGIERITTRVRETLRKQGYLT
jgi:Fic family protein